MSETYVAIDLEMTGLKIKEDRIIEIGAVLVEHDEITDTFSELVNPHAKLSEQISELTGITQTEVDRAKSIEEIFPRLLEFMGDRILLGHRISFDYAFLKRAAVNMGYPMEKRGIDTLKLSRKYLESLESKSLGAVCEYYHIATRGHRALEDAKAAHEVYCCLKRDFPEIKDEKPEQMIYKIKKEAPASKRQKERLQALCIKHDLQPDKEIDYMSKNEVSRLTDKILAKYGR